MYAVIQVNDRDPLAMTATIAHGPGGYLFTTRSEAEEHGSRVCASAWYVYKIPKSNLGRVSSELIPDLME